MIPRSLCCAAAMALLATGAFAQTDALSPQRTIPESQTEVVSVGTPMEFLSAAASANQFEIDAAELALSKQVRDGVRSLAQSLLDDHTAAQKSLLEAGAAEGLDIATPGPDGEQQAMLMTLERLDGEEFEIAFLRAQVFAHQRAIALYRGYHEGETNLHEHARSSLPKLEDHAAMVQQVSDDLGIKAEQQ
jgi:putative membrane protein